MPHPPSKQVTETSDKAIHKSMAHPVVSQATPDSITRAAQNLRDGKLVAFPTETVFGLGGDATNASAVAAIYAAKNRSPDNPLAVMVHSVAQADTLAHITTTARSLMDAFWPGPLSLVLKQKSPQIVAENALGRMKDGQPNTATIALRMPAHPVALALLRAADIPIAAPSANPSGSLSTVRALDVAASLGTSVSMILADSTPVIGLESTLIDVSGDTPVIVRLGALDRAQIESVIGPVDIHASTHAVKPLSLRTPLRLNAVDVKAGEAFLGFGRTDFIGAAGIGFVRDMPSSHWRNLSAQGDLHEAAAHLYTMLQALDTVGAAAIAVQKIPLEGLGITLNDRLNRAAQTKKAIS